MTLQSLIQSVPQSTFIIFISTFAGALAGEFYRVENNKKNTSFLKFLSTFFASWVISFAAVLFMYSTFDIQKQEIIISISIVFSFTGHKYTLNFIKQLINSKYKSD